MTTLTMMIGLPASGKSTLARDMVGNGKTCVRINRDDIRAMLYGPNSIWSGKKEGLVVDTEKAIASKALSDGINVIIDDTNLNPKNTNMWEDFTLRNNSKFKVIDLTSVPIDECIRRDSLRKERSRVGRAVIERMALFNYMLPPTLLRKQIAIFDIDGTLADGSHRNHFITNGNKNWAEYKARVWNDTLKIPVADWLCAAQKDYLIFVVSGRGTDEGIITEDWLRSYEIYPDRLFMRQGGDYREDSIIKKEILDHILAIYGRDSISFVVDDRPRCVRLWRRCGIKCFPVNQSEWEGVEE